jgi:DNA mismatch endonuclease (patch repair protein)
MGHRYRVGLKAEPDLRRTIDIAFPRLHLAVFIDGCFWHGCPKHGTLPKTNAAFWLNKITGNMARDRETDAELRERGWQVLRFWEHDDATRVVAKIDQALRSSHD